MTDPGHNTNAQLKSIVSRIEKLEEEKASIASDIKDIYAESKANGFDVKALRAIIRMRKQDANKLAEHEAIVDVYLNALGMLEGSVFESAARENALEREHETIY